MTLIEAIQANNEKVFFELLNVRVNPLGKKIIDEIDSECVGGALYWAAACGHLHFIEPLIRIGANVNKPNSLGRTPVYAAAHSGHAEIITALKAGGADVNTPDDSDTTPVCAAAYEGHAKAITALKAAGANVNAIEVNGLTPLYIAVQMRDVKVISALLEAGANVNTETPHGTPLELAKQDTTQKGQDIVRMLETHLQQYPNGIKALAATKSPSGQETCAVQMRQYDAPTIEAKADRDVVTITKGVREAEVAIGGLRHPLISDELENAINLPLQAEIQVYASEHRTPLIMSRMSRLGTVHGYESKKFRKHLKKNEVVTPVSMQNSPVTNLFNTSSDRKNKSLVQFSIWGSRIFPLALLCGAYTLGTLSSQPQLNNNKDDMISRKYWEYLRIRQY